MNNISAASGSLDMNSNKIINVDTCTLGTDATNKTYVDGLIGSFLTESAADLRYY